MRLTVLVAPGSREFDDVDAFAASLAVAAGSAIAVIEGSLAGAPDEGFLVVFDSVDANTIAGMGPRTILINADRADIPRRIERLGVAGAVEKHRYVMWRSAPADDAGDGLIGLAEVAARMDGVRTSWSVGDHFGLLAHPGCRGLPELVVAYLKALERG